MTHSLMKLRSFIVEELAWETSACFTLRLKSSSPDELFDFLPGQWVYLHLLNEDGSSWARAAFSVASAPEGSKELLEFGIKVYGDFTKRASNLIPGDKVTLQGPFGRFVLTEGESNLVMFAGGIGISPLLSMIRSLAARNADVDITLFYSNKTVEDIAYREELERIKKAWPHLRIIHFLTQEASLPEGFEAELGRLDAARLDQYLPNPSAPMYFMCGPRAFMEQVRTLLSERSVDVKKRLQEELFG